MYLVFKTILPGYGVLVVHFRGYKAVLVSLRVFNIKRSNAAFVLLFKVWSRKHMTGDSILFYNWYHF